MIKQNIQIRIPVSNPRNSINPTSSASPKHITLKLMNFPVDPTTIIGVNNGIPRDDVAEWSMYKRCGAMSGIERACALEAGLPRGNLPLHNLYGAILIGSQS